MWSDLPDPKGGGGERGGRGVFELMISTHLFYLVMIYIKNVLKNPIRLKLGGVNA